MYNYLFWYLTQIIIQIFMNIRMNNIVCYQWESKSTKITLSNPSHSKTYYARVHFKTQIVFLFLNCMYMYDIR